MVIVKVKPDLSLTGSQERAALYRRASLAAQSEGLLYATDLGRLAALVVALMLQVRANELDPAAPLVTTQ
jgi:hypothetical protein